MESVVQTKKEKLEAAARLRQIRMNTGLTQEKFAELMEISLSAYKKIESAENQISIKGLRKLEKKLKVSSDYVLFGKTENADDVWEMILNCSEYDRMILLIRLIQYYVRVKGKQDPEAEEQKDYDEEMLKILKEIQGKTNDTECFNY